MREQTRTDRGERARTEERADIEGGGRGVARVIFRKDRKREIGERK